MGGAQTLLATAAVALFMLNLTNINRSYVNSTQENVDHQRDIDAINFGLSVIEELYVAAYDYDNLYTTYSVYTDINYPSTRIDNISSIGDTLSATISITNEKILVLGETGREATVTVYVWQQGISEQVSEHYVTLIPMQ